MEITYYGHSCFSAKINGKHILFDPYITQNSLASHIDVDSIKADYIFVSHAHYDHIFDAIRIAKTTGAKVIGNFEIYNWLTKNGVENAFPMNPGGKFAFDFGTVKCVSAQHSSSFEDGSYGGIACGFIISSDNGNFYYSGDAALSLDMKLVVDFVQPDFAVFPIGDLLTMGVEEAIAAAKMIGVSNVLGVHYDTFGFIILDKEKALADFKNNGLQLHLPEIGATIEL
ncbi:L-ascorbate metabolism protein UlaG (beta-lactamase superfamily) [Chryseobacterium ginsenosidimutans]|uniref:metal-dependent hydrolase n=1 Tax=Chryseobacterium ginsenosidimutans TaxID=687846 RepID=UPI00216A3764|nr:metal-dependent hydrolase [Chryseobacterium ginsenosidimutans]MCS3870996.1 L-ascorbate metabolism protein UlaG (beta-lactamase superfamily) [Chryseobacterium ginsenosidimutans]